MYDFVANPPLWWLFMILPNAYQPLRASTVSRRVFSS